MEEKFTDCSDDTVVSWESATFKISILDKGIRQILSEQKDYFLGWLCDNMGYRIDDESFDKILNDDGIDGEILEPGAKGWQKGKMRLRVSVAVALIREEPEPEPETTEPQSPLDYLRQKLRDET